VATQRRDIVIRRGDPYPHVINGQNADGSPKDLSGTWAAQIRRYPDADEVAATFTVDASQAASGTVVLSLTEEDTAALVPGGYVWDVQWSGHGTPIGGAATVTADVTRP
jgi:hypothetical protein